MTDQPIENVKGAAEEFRESQRRPVPRFEIVHKPRRILVAPSGERLGDGPNAQPWHVRVIGGNGEPLMSTETYVDEESAYDVILAVARILGVDEPLIARTTEDRRVLSGYVADVEADAFKSIAVPILWVEVEA